MLEILAVPAPKIPEPPRASGNWSDYRTEPDRQGETDRMRIPVGMPPQFWHAYLAESLLESRFVHARWAGRCIASRVETLQRDFRYYHENSSCDPATARLLSWEKIRELVEQDHRFQDQLRVMGVSPALLEYGWEYARKVLGERFEKRRAGRYHAGEMALPEGDLVAELEAL